MIKQYSQLIYAKEILDEYWYKFQSKSKFLNWACMSRDISDWFIMWVWIDKKKKIYDYWYNANIPLKKLKSFIS